jgi:hypothetical protein
MKLTKQQTIELTQQAIVKLLNEVNSIDPKAMAALIAHKVPCNENLANHPSVITTKEQTIGLLGFVNGLFSEENRICAIMSYDGKTVDSFRALHEVQNDAMGR